MYSRRHAAAARDRAPRDIDVAVVDIFDGDLPIEARVRALWSLEGAAIDTPSSRGALATVVGALLEHPNATLAREAFEVLSLLHHGEAAPGELALACGLTKGARLAVSPRPFARCEPLAGQSPPRAWCPDLDVEVIPLVDVHLLQARLSSPLALFAGAARTTLVVAAGARLTRLPFGGALARGGPRAILERRAWRVDGPAGTRVDDVDAAVDGAPLRDHHVVRWGAGHAVEVAVVPALSDARRVLVELPDGEMSGVAIGDALFFPVASAPHARGHIAFPTPRSALLVDRSAGGLRVSLLHAGDEGDFGAYGARFTPEGLARLVLFSRVDEGPTRKSTSQAKSSAAAAKKAA